MIIFVQTIKTFNILSWSWKLFSQIGWSWTCLGQERLCFEMVLRWIWFLNLRDSNQTLGGLTHVLPLFFHNCKQTLIRCSQDEIWALRRWSTLIRSLSDQTWRGWSPLISGWDWSELRPLFLSGLSSEQVADSDQMIDWSEVGGPEPPAAGESGGTGSNQEGTDSIRPCHTLHPALPKCTLWTDSIRPAPALCTTLLSSAHCNVRRDGRYPVAIYQMTRNRLQHRLASLRS